MQIDYDPETGTHYIRLRDGEIDDTLEAGKYVFVDVDEDGVPLGLEILFAGRLLNEGEITVLEEALIDDNPVSSQDILKVKADHGAGDNITLDEYIAK